VGLPFGGGHDLGQRRAFGALHHRYNLGLLVAALGLGYAGLLGPGVLFALAFVADARFVFGCGTSSAVALFSDSVVMSIFVSPLAGLRS
jgi:hypothetical protein